MEKRLAILHANCQGEHLIRGLRSCPDFDREFEVRLYTNYIREEIPAEALESCALFLYQYLEPSWGDLASEALIARLPAGAAHLCVPNVFFRAYWPLWSGRPGFDYRDVFLDHLLDMGLSRREILHVYLKTPLDRKYDLDALLDETIAIERARETRTPVKYLDLILERYRTERLLYTINHPGGRLLAHAAEGILRQLGFRPPEPMPWPELEPYYASFEQPIHPQVARRYGLAFIDEDTVYNVYGRPKTFAQYAAAYVDCRLDGWDSFIGRLMVA